mgnify:CR=1 FL=1
MVQTVIFSGHLIGSPIIAFDWLSKKACNAPNLEDVWRAPQLWFLLQCHKISAQLTAIDSKQFNEFMFNNNNNSQSALSKPAPFKAAIN